MKQLQRRVNTQRSGNQSSKVFVNQTLSSWQLLSRKKHMYLLRMLGAVLSQADTGSCYKYQGHMTLRINARSAQMCLKRWHKKCNM